MTQIRLQRLPGSQDGLAGVTAAWKKAAALCAVAALIGISAVPRASAAPPDLDGVWLPDVKDQKRQETANVPPWKPEILPQVEHMAAEEKAGRPFDLR